MNRSIVPQLTLGPCLFHWSQNKWRDFYFKIAEESDFETVYLGEVICSKRLPNYEKSIDEIATRLTNTGKTVIRSTLALIMNAYETEALQAVCTNSNYLVEANDVAAFSYLKGKNHHVGPFINIYNESGAQFIAQQGAIQVCLPYELSLAQIIPIATQMAGSNHIKIEVQVFGRMPLALSSRCYHARAHGLRKGRCQYVCQQDDDGLLVTTLDNHPFLTVNGTCTMSYSYVNLSAELPALIANKVSAFRISPQHCDMIQVNKIWRSLLECKIDSETADHQLNKIKGDVCFSNGFYHGAQGRAFLSVT